MYNVFEAPLYNKINCEKIYMIIIDKNKIYYIIKPFLQAK